MDKPNVPATTPPIKNGKFSDMTSNMSSFSLLLLLSMMLMFADEDDDDDDDAILFEIELRLAAVVAERCNLLSSPPIPLSPPLKDVDVDDARMADADEMTTISRSVFA